MDMPVADFFDTSGFMPHGMCLLWRPFIFWLHLSSDALIATAYYSIPFALVTFVRRRRDLVFSGVFYMFSAFIFLCGTTHLMEIWTLWHPDYEISGLLKVATAGVSLVTAVALWPLMPKVLALPSPATLGRMNTELQDEVASRSAAEAHIRSLNLELEARVEARTAELAAVNERLRESEERYRRVVDLIGEGIWIHADDRILFANGRAAQMLGYPAASALIGSSPSALIAPDSRARVATQNEQLTDAPQSSIEVTLMRADGETLTADMQAVPFVEGHRKAVMTAVRDVSERRLNEELRLLLAREVDHRARNALAVAQSLVKLTRAPTMAAYAEAVEGRIRALARAHSLLSQNSWQGGDLAQILDDALSVFSKPGQVQRSGPPVTLLPNAVQPVSLVIHELATNAFKHGALQAEQGRVQIGWRTAPDGALAIDWVEAGGPAVQPPVSAGFGSTLLNEVITRQLEGQFNLEWRAEGLKVTLGLAPTSFRIERGGQSEALDATARTPAAPFVRGSRSVLIVEDDSLIAMELAAALEDAGWEIVGPALSLREGLALIKDGPPLDAAILDVNLAGRAVYPLAEAVRARDVPFVFCTGYEMVDTAGRFLDVPVLRKPVNIDLLCRELAALLAGKVAG